jgi:hypothetical protein
MSIIEDLTSLVQCGSHYDCETLKKLLLAEPECASNMSLCEALKSAIKLDQDGNIFLDIPIGIRALEFHATGENPFVAEDGVFDDEKFPLTRDRQGQASKPDFDFTNLGLLFPQNDATEIVYIIGQFSHKRKAFTNIAPHVHFIQDNALTPVFKMDYRWYENGDLMPGAFTTITAATFAFTYTAGNMLQIAAFPDIDGSAIGSVSSMMDIKLYREDNVAIGDVLTKEFDLHYEIDSLGSKEEYVK